MPKDNAADSLLNFISSVRSYATATRASSPVPRVLEIVGDEGVEKDGASVSGVGAPEMGHFMGQTDSAVEVPTEVQDQALVHHAQQEILGFHAGKKLRAPQQQCCEETVVQFDGGTVVQEGCVLQIEEVQVVQNVPISMCASEYGPVDETIPDGLRITEIPDHISHVLPAMSTDLAPSKEQEASVATPVPHHPGHGRTPPPKAHPTDEYEYDFFGRLQKPRPQRTEPRDPDDESSSAFMGEGSDDGRDGDDEGEGREPVGYSRGVRGTRGLASGVEPRMLAAGVGGMSMGIGMDMSFGMGGGRIGPFDPLEGHVPIISLLSSSSSSSSSSCASTPAPPPLILIRKRPPPTPTPPRSPTPISSPSSSSAASSLLEFTAKRRRVEPLRTGPWNSTDRMLLVECLQDGVDFEALAEVMGRTPGDVFERFSDVVAAALYEGCAGGGGVGKRDWGVQTEERGVVGR